MPVRAVNLKLVVPRQTEGLEFARALWGTHDAVNKATAYYERLLLLCRQQDYVTREKSFNASSLDADLADLIARARQRNAYTGQRDEQETRKKLRLLYEAIVPTAIGDKGTAKDVNDFVGPLVDPDSKGLKTIFEKIKDPPNWVEGVRADEAEAFEAAYAWLSSPRGQERLHVTGRPTTWAKLAKAGDPTWPASFVEDLDNKIKKAPGAPRLVQDLRDLGVLPLFRPYFADRIEGYTGAVSPWDRLAMRLAVAHLLSWQSWVNKARDEHQKREEKLRNFIDTRIDEDAAKSVHALRQYEKQRAKQLREDAGWDVEKVRTTSRTIRGWSDLREKWLKNTEATEEERIELIASEQDRLRGRFGDVQLFRWLAKRENEGIWRTSAARDDVSLFTRLRAMELLVERSRDTAFMTFPDSRAHPRSPQWEPHGGRNLKKFKLEQPETGRLRVSLPLLTPIASEKYREQALSFDLAKSQQLADCELQQREKKYWLCFRAQTGEVTAAEVGAADLLLDWYRLRQRSISRIEAGDIGPAFLKLALDMQPLDPVGDLKKTPPAIHHFQTASGSKTRHADKVSEGFRLLSVDLGMRTFATCSVFELRGDVKKASGLFFEVTDLPFVAAHERSFMLQLDGEDVDQAAGAWRRCKSDELSRLRRWLTRYRNLRALHDADASSRTAALLDLGQRIETDGWPFEREIVSSLSSSADAPEPVWQRQLDQTLIRYRQGMAPVIAEWRKSNRARSVTAKSGKSMWAIEHLTSTRRFLQSWSLLSERGVVNRLDNEKYGIFAKHILDHLAALKEDRLKTGADLIVQAARGFRRNKSGKWEKVYEPCHAILFEDLTRYRMRTDRPRRENSQLMKWAHRAIPVEVEMQAEMFGISVAETGAAFSSRFHAATHTPGIRMHALRSDDVKNEFLIDIIERSNPGTKRDDLKVGQLVQLDGGEIFVCCKDDGLHQIHADINAAQNLQRRFFTRHGDAFRIVARKVLVDGSEVWVPRSLGKRLLGGLGGYGFLRPTGHDSGSCRFERADKRHWSRMAGETIPENEGLGSEEDEEMARLEEESLELTGEVVVFFRDPSGVILPAELWYPAKSFWSIVKAKTLKVVGQAA